MEQIILNKSTQDELVVQVKEMLKTKDRVNLGLHLMARYDLYTYMSLVEIGEQFVLDNKFDYL